MRQMLIFNEDLQFNQRVGMPVKIYCRTRQKTLAFGRIQAITPHFINVSRTWFMRRDYLIIGIAPTE
ncbi:hypothetical protein ACE1TF_12445 [Geomicrobium sp. JSM 1781026]|uniref:hypothetical protein n=1 Tax=Geomicrobium sp. JSM 1781026 TaxID=3344580 RepID=UPI0035C22AD1